MVDLVLTCVVVDRVKTEVGVVRVDLVLTCVVVDRVKTEVGAVDLVLTCVVVDRVKTEVGVVRADLCTELKLRWVWYGLTLYRPVLW